MSYVFGDGEVKINLAGPGDEPELVWAVGTKRNEVRKAMAWSGNIDTTFKLHQITDAQAVSRASRTASAWASGACWQKRSTSVSSQMISARSAPS